MEPNSADEGRVLPGLAVGTLAALGAVKLVAHLLTNPSYGFHRDELYYLVCGRHLAWGYVDHPPLTALLAAAAEAVFGVSVAGLRLLPAVCGAIIVVLAGLMAREMGGRAWAQGLAAAAVLASPVYLLTNGLFQTVTFDQLAWVACTFLLLRIFRTGRRGLWLGVGLAAGVGLLTKHTILLFGFGLVVGLVLTRQRQQFRLPQLWVAGVIAALLALPNVFWQVGHGWPTLEFMANSSARAAAEFPLPAFLGLQIIFIGAVSVPLFVAGLVFLFGRQGERFRVVGWICVSVVALLAWLGGKPYYPASIYPAILAAGAVATEALAARRNWRRLRYAVPAVILLGTVPTLWMTLPVVPRETFAARQDAWPHKEYHEMFGWQDLAAQVALVYDALPDEDRRRASLLTDAYGEAAALELFGPALGLPRVASGHDSYYFWGPPDSDVVVAVAWSGEYLERFFADVRKVAPVTNALGIRNEASAKAIFVCRNPRQPWNTLWPLLRGFI